MFYRIEKIHDEVFNVLLCNSELCINDCQNIILK